MPGFIIHLTEAAMIMEHMKKQPDSDWKQEFLLGNLLPDTRLGKDKAISHFWRGGLGKYCTGSKTVSFSGEIWGSAERASDSGLLCPLISG